VTAFAKKLILRAVVQAALEGPQAASKGIGALRSGPPAGHADEAL